MLSLAATALILPFFRIVRNQCARSSRFHGVQQTYRNVGIFSRLDTSRVQNLCTEVGQFSCFFKVKLTYRRSLVYYARVIVVHTVDVCPDLDFRSIDGSSNQRSRIVTSSTLQVVDFTVCVAADESLSDIDFITRVCFQLCRQFFRGYKSGPVHCSCQCACIPVPESMSRLRPARTSS